VTRLRTFCSRLMRIVPHRRSDREMDAEFSAHLEMLTEANMRRGMTREQARQAARREFGGLEQTKETYREQFALLWLEGLLLDMRGATRILRRTPGFTSAAVLTLALGLATLVTIFSITESILWKPLPYPDSERLVAVYAKTGNHTRSLDSLTVPEYLSWQRENKTFTEMAAFRWAEEYNLAAAGRVERARVASVSENFFSTFGVPPVIGRPFSPSEDTTPSNDVILSYACWTRLFPSGHTLSGQTIRLEDQTYSVVGVLPPDFTFESLWKVDVFTPISFTPSAPSDRSTRGLEVIARLAPGATVAESNADLGRLARRDAAMFPATDGNWTAQVEALRVSMTHYYLPKLLFFLGAAVFVFLVACANTANLLLARALRRRPELALRVSLGAGRWTILRQLLAESVWIAVLASGCALIVAHWSVQLFVRFASSPEIEIPRIMDISLDPQAFGFAVLFAFAAVATAGLPSAWIASRIDPQEALKGAGNGAFGIRTQSRFRDLLVVSEITLSLVLLAGAGLFIKSLFLLDRISPGFDPHGLLTMQVSLRGSGYADDRRVLASLREIEENARSLHGVLSSTVGSSLAFFGTGAVRFTVEGRAQPESEEKPSSLVRAVSPSYFATLKIPLLRGRAFDNSDRRDSVRVAVVNENFARHFFRDRDPVGQSITILSAQDGGEFLSGRVQIVGLAANTKEVGLDEVQFDSMYVPLAQNPVRSAWLAVRTERESAEVAAGLRRAVASVNANQPISEIVPMEQRISASLSENRLHLVLAAAFAVVAVLLAAIGVYAVLSYSIAQRIREFGLRMALGAQRSSVLGLVIRQSAGLVLPGLLLGLGLSVALGQILGSMLYLVPYQHVGLLYGVSTHDPFLLASAAVLLSLVALLGTIFPARNATNLDPIHALRYE
jgi:predicted permease